jgi:cytochrome c556
MEETFMRVRVIAPALVLAWSCAVGVAVMAQTQKVTTPEQLDKVMKAVQQANQPVGKAIASGAYADARKGLAAVKENVAASRTFWVEHKKDDAVKLNEESVGKIEALEKLLSAPTVDGAAAAAAMKEVGGSCRACHQKYRATDAENNYILKPGWQEAK